MSRARYDGTFVGVDGEAIDGNYCVIQDSQDGILESHNFEPLSTRACLEWFLERAQVLSHLHPIFIAYGFSYDVDMICRDLPDDLLRQLVKRDEKDPVEWQGFKLLYFKKKFFRVTRGRQTVTIYDTITFFQTSFVKALKGVCHGHAFLPLIEEWKQKRSTFARTEYRGICEYNRLECAALVDLLSVLRSMFLSNHIYLRKWHGPGSVADFLLGPSGYNVHTDYPSYRREDVPVALWNAWDHAFFGGRIESLVLGTYERDIFEHDISSAYPYIISQLPKLKYTRFWKREAKASGVDSRTYGLCAVFRVSWNLSEVTTEAARFGPFPFRRENGSIYFPRNGTGWYWSSEVQAALELFPGAIRVHEVWYQDGQETSKLAGIVNELYLRRQILKDRGDLGEKALKLALNSLYGKLAQRLGRASYYCEAWAGMITAGTRAMLLRACKGNMEHVLGFATDSIFTTKPLDVPLSSKLGDWKRTSAKRFTCLMNGFYIFDDGIHADASERGSKCSMCGDVHVKCATRGYNPDEVEWAKLLDDLSRDSIATREFQIFVGHALAINFPQKWGPDRLKFVKAERVIRPLISMKRGIDIEKLDFRNEHYLTRILGAPRDAMSARFSLERTPVGNTLEEMEGEAQDE